MAYLPEGKQEILFTLQEHNAEKAGPHKDVRLVLGDKAFSFATKKELPKVGESIILYEQPLHSRDYALSQKVIIPIGQYGAGETVLKYVKRAVMESKGEYHTITLGTGEKYLLKPVPSYSDKAWLFKNLGKEDMVNRNKYLEKIAGLPITEKNLAQAAKTYTNIGLNFAKNSRVETLRLGTL